MEFLPEKKIKKILILGKKKHLSYLTILDYVVLLSYVFATIPNFISIYSFEKFRSKKVIWKKVDRNSRIYGPLIYLILVIIIIIFNVSGNYNTNAFLSFLIW